MPNINIQIEVQKAEAKVLAAVADFKTFEEIMRLQGRVDALRDLIAMIDSGTGNEPTIEPPPPALRLHEPEPEPVSAVAADPIADEA